MINIQITYLYFIKEDHPDDEHLVSKARCSDCVFCDVTDALSVHTDLHLACVIRQTDRQTVIGCLTLLK